MHAFWAGGIRKRNSMIEQSSYRLQQINSVHDYIHVYTRTTRRNILPSRGNILSYCNLPCLSSSARQLHRATYKYADKSQTKIERISIKHLEFWLVISYKSNEPGDRVELYRRFGFPRRSGDNLMEKKLTKWGNFVIRYEGGRGRGYLTKQ